MKRNRLPALVLAAAVVLSTACGARAADDETRIVLSDEKVTVDGRTASTDPESAVYTGAEIVYYHDGTDETYGEGTETEKHSAEEAGAHTVVTITQPGTYRLSGELSRGQIAIDLGSDAKDDPEAVVTLILDGVDVTCTVAPALIFYNVYECDREFVAYDNDENPDYQATPDVDTTAAGANVFIAAGTENNFTGSHVARIYKEGTTKKLHKYDAAFYSKMSMNVDGADETGVLNIVSDNEGLDAELHLTINGGRIYITSQDDGINTNEDFVSVTTINGGWLTVDAGNGAEGDGIDSNGYLVINGGAVWTMANERSGDGGIDADSPIQINGGSVSAFGTRNDAADSASRQPYMELAFASTLPAGSVVELRGADGQVVWGAETLKTCQSITLSGPELALDTPYQLYVDDVLQCWSGNSFGMMGGRGGMGGQRPDGMTRPDGQQPPVTGEGAPQPFDGAGELPQRPDRGERPENFDPSQLPEGFDPTQFGHGGMGGFGGQTAADGSGFTEFTLTETTKSFSGVCDSDASGKTRVSFTVEGAQRVGWNTVLETITAITSSVDIDPALVQVTVTDDPSENCAASCKLSDGLEAVNALLPEDDGDYILTVAAVSGNETYTGATQLSFAVGALPFTDVREGDESYDAVKALYEAGVMEGVGGGRFDPEGTVTRAQAVTVLARLSGAGSAGSDAFSDVEAGSWYSGFVGWAVENGIVEGDGQGHFFPHTAVTGEQMALMLSRLEEGFTDATGFTGELTRAQLARMAAQLLEK